jgi:hypothetical protein
VELWRYTNCVPLKLRDCETISNWPKAYSSPAKSKIKRGKSARSANRSLAPVQVQFVLSLLEPRVRWEKLSLAPAVPARLNVELGRQIAGYFEAGINRRRDWFCPYFHGFPPGVGNPPDVGISS